MMMKKGQAEIREAQERVDGVQCCIDFMVLSGALLIGSQFMDPSMLQLIPGETGASAQWSDSGNQEGSEGQISGEESEMVASLEF
jgi:hypothetical protein